jgi:hypothetical protein
LLGEPPVVAAKKSDRRGRQRDVFLITEVVDVICERRRAADLVSPQLGPFILHVIHRDVTNMYQIVIGMAAMRCVYISRT